MSGTRRTQTKRSGLGKREGALIAAALTAALDGVKAWDAFRNKKGKEPDVALHYLFSPKGKLLPTFLFVADESPWDGLWPLLEGALNELSKIYSSKRIQEAVEAARQIGKVDAALSEPFAALSFELEAIEGMPPKELHRRRGKSRFSGLMVGDRIFIPRDSTAILVGDDERYSVTGDNDWIVMDRILTAVWKGERESTIRITTKEWNALQDDRKKFVEKYIRRDPLPKELRHSNRHQFAETARFLYDKLPK